MILRLTMILGQTAGLSKDVRLYVQGIDWLAALLHEATAEFLVQTEL